MIDPDTIADRILAALDPETVGDRVAFAHAFATLALAHEQRTANLIAAIAIADDLDPAARAILLAVIRRRLRVIPVPPGDGSRLNGGT